MILFFFKSVNQHCCSALETNEPSPLCISVPRTLTLALLTFTIAIILMEPLDNGNKFSKILLFLFLSPSLLECCPFEPTSLFMINIFYRLCGVLVVVIISGEPTKIHVNVGQRVASSQYLISRWVSFQNLDKSLTTSMGTAKNPDTLNTTKITPSLHAFKRVFCTFLLL